MTLRNTGLAIALIVTGNVAASAADVPLRWKFRTEKPYKYVLTQGMDMSMKLPNNAIKTTMSQVSDMTWKVKKVNPDGSADMTQTLDRMQVKVEGPAGKFEIDSQKKDANPQAGPLAALTKMMEGIVGTPIDLILSARGEVLSVKVPDKFMEAMKTAGPQGQAFAGAFSEKGMKQLIEQGSLLLPEKGVSPGTTWEQKRSVETAGLGNIDIDATYTDRGEAAGKPGVRKIDGEVKMQFHQPENAQFTVRVTSQDNKANFYFDTKQGHLSRSEMKQTMQMEIGAQGQQFSQEITQTVSMTLAGDSGSK